MFLVKVIVQPKTAVNDPQGQTILSGLRQLGFSTVAGVRGGKYLEVRLDEVSETVAKDKVEEMCERLLANPVIEDYHVELESISE